MKLTKIEGMRNEIEINMELHNAHQNGIEIKKSVTIEEGEEILKKITRRKFSTCYVRDGVFYVYGKKNRNLCCPGIRISKKLNYYIVKIDDDCCDKIETRIYKIN